MPKKTSLLLLFLLILSSCSAFSPPPTPTPTLDAATWKIYQDLNHGISFVYPKAYDDHSICALHVQGGDLTTPDFVVSMDNSFLKVTLTPLANPKETDPQNAVNDLRSYLSGSYQIRFDDPVKRTVDGLPALSQRYFVAYNKDGYLEDTFFIKKGVLYDVFVQTPSTCDGYPNAPATEEAYQRILESFIIQ
jgi:hypothetical protein